MAPFTPEEVDLRAALIALKIQFPQLGIAKIHARLLDYHPEWLVSEKRTRRILQQEGLTIVAAPGISPDPSQGDPTGGNVLSGSARYPTSKLIDHLDIRQWTSKVRVKYFNKKKGKGLVATADIEEGETLWKEDPWIISPEWDLYDLQQQSASCGYCTTPFKPDSPLINPCPSTSASHPSPCKVRFCNRLCLARSAKSHPLLCPAQNPASIPLMKWARETGWMAFHALAQSTSRVLLANQLGEAAWSSDWTTFKALAELGMEERYVGVESYAASAEPDRESWKMAHSLYVRAFKSPRTPEEERKLAKILKKKLPVDASTDLFEYSGFLKNLGKMSLNLEAHGGLYTLHSHLNHSCSPNVSIRHLDQRTALSRITVLARRPIRAGEELVITYVDPKLPYKSRQQDAKKIEQNTTDTSAPQGNDLDGLAEELKAGLGVM